MNELSDEEIYKISKLEGKILDKINSAVNSILNENRENDHILTVASIAAFTKANAALLLSSSDIHKQRLAYAETMYEKIKQLINMFSFLKKTH